MVHPHFALGLRSSVQNPTRAATPLHGAFVSPDAKGSPPGGGGQQEANLGSRKPPTPDGRQKPRETQPFHRLAPGTRVQPAQPPQVGREVGSGVLLSWGLGGSAGTAGTAWSPGASGVKGLL